MRLGSAFLQTLFTQLMQTGASLVTGVLIARALGPTGQGGYAVIAAAVALGAVLAGLGQFQGNVIAAADGRAEPRVLLVRAVLHGLVAALLLLATRPLWNQRISHTVGSALGFLFVAVLAAEVIAQLVRGINLGQRHVTGWNTATLTQRFAYLAGVAALVLTGRARLEPVLACWAVATLLSVAVSGLWIWLRSHATSVSLRRLWWGWGAGLSVAMRAFVAVGVTLLLVRCDVWMLGPMLGVGTVGQMSVATTLAEWLWYIPSILGNLLFTVVAADSSGRSVRQICRGTRAVVMMLLPAALLLLFAGQRLVIALYGNAYESAGTLFILLLPGMTAIGIHLVVDAFFAGKGFPPISIWSAVAALVAKVGLNLIVVPSFGAPGAAVVTSFVYTGLLTVKVTAFTHRTGTSLATLLIPGRGDFQYLTTLARAGIGA